MRGTASLTFSATAIAVAFLLVGCSSPTVDSSETSAGMSPPGDLVLKADGLGIAGSRLEVGFGRSQAGAIRSASKLVGRQPSSTNAVPGCGSMTAVRWSSGFEMTFRNGDFLGWSSTAKNIPTNVGLSVGAPVSGNATNVGGITAQPGPDGTIIRLSAGEAC